MAMWKSSRVSVRVIRRDSARFLREADYLYALGQCPNIPRLLGAHWEHPVNAKQKSTRKEEHANLGYLVMQVANGFSLDKLVRDAKLPDTVTQIRVLDRVLAALLYAQNINPAITHQDLHPGNILLVPSPIPKPSSSPNLTSHSHPSISSDSTDTSTIILSHSTLGESSTGHDPEFSLVTREAPPPPQRESSPPSPIHPPVHIHAPPLLHLSQPAKSNHSHPNNHHSPKLDHHVNDTLNVLHRVALNTSVQTTDTPLTRKSTVPHLNSQRHPSRIHRPRIPIASPYASSTVTHTTVSMASMDDHSKDRGLPLLTSSTDSSFTVKVMDFAPAHEAHGLRSHFSWDKNPALAGYCAPEKATVPMWRKMHQKKEKNRERDLDRRITHTRNSSNTHHSPRPSSRRRSANALPTFIPHTPRSSSKADHRPFDSETYGLLEDDHLVDLPDSDGITPAAEPSSPPDRSGRHAVARGPTAQKQQRRKHGVVLDGEAPYSNAEFAAQLYNDDGDDFNDDDAGEAEICGDDVRKKYSRHEDMIRKNLTPDVTENDGSNNVAAKEQNSKIDVWSIGWLLYYMATGKHPPQDSWARPTAIDNAQLAEVAPECRKIIQMCVQQEVHKRAGIRDVKRHIDSILQGLMFERGLSLIETERTTAFILLDKAVGIKLSRGKGTAAAKVASAMGGTHISASSSGVPQGRETEGRSGDCVGTDVYEEDGRALGLNQKTRRALATLPLVVVRRVEWEAAARYLRRSEEEIKRLRGALVNEKWNKSDVKDGDEAVAYLSKRSSEGVSSAQSALGWVYRWGAGGVKKDVAKAMKLWVGAVGSGDAEACNGLGLVYHHGRENVPFDGEKARSYYQIAVDQGYPAAAVNLGVMLHDGAAGVAADGVAARGLYEMACRHGDAIAANNLGLLLQHGAPGVEADGAAAVRAYEMAIARNERHHACRNLAELLWYGMGGVKKARPNALEYFSQAIERGDASSKAAVVAKLKKIIRLSEEQEETDDGFADGLLERCRRLVAGAR